MNTQCKTGPDPVLRLRRVGIDTYQEPIIYMHSDCHVCRAEGFGAQARILVRHGSREIIATMNVVHSDWLTPGEAGLSEAAWKQLEAREGDEVRLSHAPPIASLGHLRSKIFGNTLGDGPFREIIMDIISGRYMDIHLSSFITACADDRLDRNEIISLTRAMVGAGDRMDWGSPMVADKHCVGGLPGNRTTPLVVAIIAANGIVIPKTSSRAITSPAGTADTMETLTPVTLSLSTMRRVVEKEGGCIAWGGGMHLSPADDILIRIEHALDIDSDGQLVASILSKKIAAGSTHAIIDIPVGPTAKVRTPEAAAILRDHLVAVGQAVGLQVRVILTDGHQPVGRGIGPALEAWDVLAVLKGDPNAPHDLKERGVHLAGELLEIAGAANPGMGQALARQTLEEGRAWRKFEAICRAQGGMREPPKASHTTVVPATSTGRVVFVDNRRLARIAKLAGAPKAPAAGILLHARIGELISRGEPLFTVHAESPGELDYALTYLSGQTGIIQLENSAP
ncbi:MAG: thymidine phosphorylase family protein [Planctomycetota bacterium]